MPSSPPCPVSLLLASTDVAYPPRRLLLHTSVFRQQQPPAPAAASPAGEPSFDANVIMILAVLLCALVCAIGLNSIVRCALRCSTAAVSRPPPRCRGNEGGMKKAALRTIPTVAYKVDGVELPCSSWSECAICLSEFKEGERVRVLPGCNHGFHVGCVDRWLRANTTCPTCRGRCVVEPEQKMKARVGSQPTDVGPSPPPRSSFSAILLPLDREGLMQVEYTGWEY